VCVSVCVVLQLFLPSSAEQAETAMLILPTTLVRHSMSFIQRTLTSVAVDSVRDYLKEKLEKLKQLDLDKDGQKDVDQITELLIHVSAKLKDSIESTDFPKLALGMEQIMSGASLIGASVDREKLKEAVSELGVTMKQLGKLAQLGIQEMKREEHGNQLL
jgi:hypothetical protein